MVSCLLLFCPLFIFLLYVTLLIYFRRFIIFIKWVLNTLTVILFIERQSLLSAPLLLILSLACVAIKKKSPLFLLINFLMTFSNILLVKIIFQNILWSNFYLQLCIGNNLSWKKNLINWDGHKPKRKNHSHVLVIWAGLSTSLCNWTKTWS